MLRKTLIWLGLLLAVTLILFVVGVLWPQQAPAPNARPASLLIVNVSVVDLAEGRIVPGQNILIANDQIQAMGSNVVADGADTVDGTGRFAIPGLFDMHTHAISSSPVFMHPLYVAAGVTAVRDMGGCVGPQDAWVACAPDKRRWHTAVAQGEMVGPRYDHVTSLAVNGGSEIPASMDPVLGGASVEGARARVELDHQRGIDFLKPYSSLPRAGYFELALAAREHDMYLAGHLPAAVSAHEAMEAGQRSIEHALLFLRECFPGRNDFRDAARVRELLSVETRRRMLDEHDAASCENLFAAMREHGTAFVPTHTTRKLDAFASNEAYRNDRRLKYVPSPLRTLWLQDADAMAAREAASGMTVYRETYDHGLRLTGLAHAAGVTVLAGTDAPDSFAFPGSGLHDELEHLVQAGLTPLEALRTATSAPASFLGLERRAGILDVGARADVVLLDENPLADIRAVRQIHAVVLAGTLYSRDDLDALLAGVEDAASSWSVWPKFAWQWLTSPIMRRQFGD